MDKRSSWLARCAVSLRRLSFVLVFVGLLPLGYCAYEFAIARLYQAREMQHFAGGRRDRPSPFPARPYPATGSVVGKLEIPRIALSTVVVEGANEGALRLGPGHIPGTSLPGEGGNVGVAGHRDTFFRPLRLARVNDEITMRAGDREYRYQIVSTRVVEPHEVEVLSPTREETLTLVTCYPFHFIGAAPKRFIVSAVCMNCPPIMESHE